MYPIDREYNNLTFSFTRIFRPEFKGKSMRVFLCGEEVRDKYFDLRHQVKHLIENEMGCKAFLGEDIEDFKIESIKKPDHLTIEVNEAKKSDIIIMFLGSPGTISELTAFCLDKTLNDKLIIFNMEKYRDGKSFIALGPLKLIRPNQLIFYDINKKDYLCDIIKHLDFLVALAWYKTSKHLDIVKKEFAPELFFIYCIVRSFYPVLYKDILKSNYGSDHDLRKGLKVLFNKNLIKTDEGKYLIQDNFIENNIKPGWKINLDRIRLQVMNIRLKETENIANYRLIL